MTSGHTDSVLSVLLAALDESGLHYALMGGYAVLAWGIPRATYDVDLLIESAPEKIASFLEACEKRGFVVEEPYKEGWRDRIRDMSLLKVQFPRGERLITVDVFPVSTPFQESSFGRLALVDPSKLGRRIPVISPADLILFKLMADRPKDRVDVLNILTIQGFPEPEYLRDWAKRLGVEDRLARALAQSGQ